MKAQRVFFVLGLAVAAFTGVMVFRRMTGARPEPLPFVTMAPGDTVLYIAIPDHQAFADSVAGSAAWKRAGLQPWLDRYRAARPLLAKATGPSMAFFLRRGGVWTAFFRLLHRPEAESGELDGVRWVARGDVLAVSESDAWARSALDGPRALLGDLGYDRELVCGATRAPFAWLDLRSMDLPGRLGDIGGLAFSAKFGEAIEVRALGNYYTAERSRIYREFMPRTRRRMTPPPGAVAWQTSFDSPSLRWKELLARVDRNQAQHELDQLATEFLKTGRVEEEVIPNLGPEWGMALFDADRVLAFVRIPDDVEPLLRRAVADAAKKFAVLDGDVLHLPTLKRDVFVAFRGRTLMAATERGLLADPGCIAFAERAAGEWHIGAGGSVADARRVLDEIAGREGWPSARFLDGVSWASSIDARGRYGESGVTIEITIR